MPGIICSWRNNLPSSGGLSHCWFTQRGGWLGLEWLRRLSKRMIMSLWIGCRITAFRKVPMLLLKIFTSSTISISKKWSKHSNKSEPKIPTTPSWLLLKDSSPWILIHLILKHIKKFVNNTTPIYWLIVHMTLAILEKKERASGMFKDSPICPMYYYWELEANVFLLILGLLVVMIPESLSTLSITQLPICSPMPSTQSKQPLHWPTWESSDQKWEGNWEPKSSKTTITSEESLKRKVEKFLAIHAQFFPSTLETKSSQD